MDVSAETLLLNPASSSSCCDSTSHNTRRGSKHHTYAKSEMGIAKVKAKVVYFLPTSFLHIITTAIRPSVCIFNHG